MKIYFFIFLLLTSCFYTFAVDKRIDNEIVKKLEMYQNNEKGWSPLNYAIELEDYEVALIICDYTTDVNIINDGFNSINRVFYKECKKINLSFPAESRPKMDKNALKLLWKLVDKGANIQAVSGDPPSSLKTSTPLAYACYLGLEEFVIEFLNRCAHLDRHKSKPYINQKGGMPLNTAIRAGYLNIVRLLVDRGADVNSNSLLTAVRVSDYKAIDILLQAGADINQKDLLMVAITQNSKKYVGGLSMLEFLLERGSNPNAKGLGAEGKSILEAVLNMPINTEAQQLYKTEVVNILLNYGAIF